MTAMKLFTTLQKYVGSLNNLAVKIRNEEIEAEEATIKAKELIQEMTEIII